MYLLGEFWGDLKKFWCFDLSVSIYFIDSRISFKSLFVSLLSASKDVILDSRDDVVLLTFYWSSSPLHPNYLPLRMLPLTHGTHKHTWSHVYNSVGWDHLHITLTNTQGLMFTTMYHETIDTWHSETHMVSCLQQWIMRPLTPGTKKHTWSHVYNSLTLTNSHGLMFTAL